jgi:uncharacterized protein (TIGR00255 family)
MDLMSMTGFGRARGRLSDRFGASIVIRSVNHKYLDLQIRTNLREEVPEIEAAVRGTIEERFQRGRLTAQLNLEQGPGAGPRVALDTVQIEAVLEQLAAVRLPDGVAASLAVGDVLAVPGLVSVSAPETILDRKEAEALRSVTEEAVDLVLTMRRDEGRRIARQIASELAQVVAFADWFEPQLPDLRQAMMTRAMQRIAELAGSSVDADRVAQEAAVLADRADVAEEVVRLRAHLAAFDDRMAAGGAVGRSLDFLCQEIHRELNTLGSKCREPATVARLVDAKSAAERVREQVQNLE